MIKIKIDTKSIMAYQKAANIFSKCVKDATKELNDLSKMFKKMKMDKTAKLLKKDPRPFLIGKNPLLKK